MQIQGDYFLSSILLIDNNISNLVISINRPDLVPTMYQDDKTKYKTLIKFTAPENLKRDLQQLAIERNITLSSLLRLISSEYIKRNNGT
jgi:hypothetical protein